MSTPRILAAIFFIAFHSTQALASPTFFYGFSVKSFPTCTAPSNDLACTPANIESFSYWKDELEKLTIGLNIDAFPNGQASLLVQTISPSAIIANQGVSYLNLSRWNPLGFSEVPLDPSVYPYDAYVYPFVLGATFDVSSYLTGEFSVRGWESEFFMSSSGSRTWSGSLNSDALPIRLDFTGEWRFVRAVPEPSTLVLLFGAALAVAGMGRKGHARRG